VKGAVRCEGSVVKRNELNSVLFLQTTAFSCFKQLQCVYLVFKYFLSVVPVLGVSEPLLEVVNLMQRPHDALLTFASTSAVPWAAAPKKA